MTVYCIQFYIIPEKQAEYCEIQKTTLFMDKLLQKVL